MTDRPRTERRFLLELLRPYRHVACLIVLASLFASLFDVFSIAMLVPLLGSLQGMEGNDKLPSLVRHAMELLSPYSVETQIFVSIGIVMTSVLCKNALLGLSIYFGYWLSSRLAADMRTRATTMLMNVGIEYYHRTKSGELIEKTLQNTAFLEDMTRNIVEMIAYIITFLVFFGLLVYMSWQLTLIILVLGILFMWLISAYTRSLSPFGEKFATSSRELHTSVHENISGIQLIKSFAREKRQLKRLKQSINRHQRNTLQLNFRNYIVHLLTDILGACAIGGLFIVTMFMSELDTKVLFVLLFPFVYIITRLIPVLKQINIARAMISSRWPFVTLVNDFLRMDNKPSVPDGSTMFPGLKNELRYENVTFSYGRDLKPALADVSFSVKRGKTTAIVGQSGSGKSTIVNLLLRFYDPLQGAVLVDGVPLTEFDCESYRRKVGVVSQDVFIFNDSVSYNIGFGADGEVPQARILDAARKAGAHEFIMNLKDGYDTMLGDRGVKLSGGQRQRISIARAVLRDPEILILDEATSSLDTRMEKLIHRAIDELGRNRTLIIIAHRLSTIRNADEIIVMKHGRVQEIGSAEQLLRQRGEYYMLSQIDSDRRKGMTDIEGG